MSKPSEAVGFVISVVFHAAVLGVCLLAGMLPSGGCQTRQQELEIPIGFMVEGAEVEETPAPVAEPTPPKPEPQPEPEPEPAPEPEPEPEPEPVPLPPEPTPEPPKKPDPPKTDPPKKQKHEVVVSKKVVKRGPETKKPQPQPQPKTPSAADIQKIMGPVKTGPIGSPTGSATATLNADNAALARIKAALERAWIKPSYEERGSGSVSLRLTFRGPSGAFASDIAQSSGSAAMDSSILNAARGVGSFSFLPSGFTDRNPSITVIFTLD